MVKVSILRGIRFDKDNKDLIKRTIKTNGDVVAKIQEIINKAVKKEIVKRMSIDYSKFNLGRKTLVNEV